MHTNRRLSYRTSHSNDIWLMDADDRSRKSSEHEEYDFLHGTIIENPLRKSSHSMERCLFLLAKRGKMYTIPLEITYSHMAQITQNDFTFTLLDEIELQYPELVKLIL